MGETLARTRTISVDVLMDTVTLKLHCGDEYEAQVLFDDLVERLQSGQGITLSVNAKPRARRKSSDSSE